MATEGRTRADWAVALRAGASRPISEKEKARRRAETARLRALRDRLGRIAPDTVSDYVRQTRDDADRRP